MDHLFSTSFLFSPTYIQIPNNSLLREICRDAAALHEQRVNHYIEWQVQQENERSNNRKRKALDDAAKEEKRSTAEKKAKKSIGGVKPLHKNRDATMEGFTLDDLEFEGDEEVSCCPAHNMSYLS